MGMWLCERKLKVKIEIAHFRLPSASQKRAPAESKNMQLYLIVPRSDLKKGCLEARSSFVNSGNSEYVESPIAEIRDPSAARGKPIKGLLLTRSLYGYLRPIHL